MSITKNQKKNFSTLALLFCSSVQTMAEINVFDYVEYSKKHQFDHVVFFGDSLTDPGSGENSRFVAGGLDYPGYFDVLTKQLTDKPSLYKNYGGTNYAVKAVNSEGVYQQIKDYLADNRGVASKNNLYVLWSGGTDVNTGIIFNIPRLPFYDFNKNNYTLGNTGQPTPADYIYDSANLLINSGAPYVIVPNIPSAGYAPITSLFLIDIAVTLLDEILPTSLNKQITNEIKKAVGSALGGKLRSLPQGGSGVDYLENQAIEALQQQLLIVPRPIVKAIYELASGIQHNIARQFNYSTLQALMPLDGKIMYLDIAGLFSESINNATEWKIDSINLTACTLGYSASACNKETGTFYDDRNYLFGDWFHPSWQTHVAIARYILSVLNAPDMVSTIVRQIKNLNDNSQSILQSHLSNGRLNNDEQDLNHWQVFGNYSASFVQPKSYIGGAKNDYTSILNLGFEYGLTPNWQLGTMLSLSFGKQKPYKDFTYKQTSQNILFFTQWQSSDHQFWANANINYARLKAKNIERSVNIYQIYRMEPAENTTAELYGINGRMGWNIFAKQDNKDIQTGPFAGLSFNHYKLKGYQEKLNTSSSMIFADSSYNQNYATLGWYINTNQFNIKEKPLTLSAELSYNQNFKQKDFEISSRIKHSPLSFTKDVELAKSKRWLDLNTQASLRIDKESDVNLGLGFKFDNKKNKNYQLSLGYSRKF